MAIKVDSQLKYDGSFLARVPLRTGDVSTRAGDETTQEGDTSSDGVSCITTGSSRCGESPFNGTLSSTGCRLVEASREYRGIGVSRSGIGGHSLTTSNGRLLRLYICPLTVTKYERLANFCVHSPSVQRSSFGSSAVECRTRNQVRSGSNPPLLPFRRLGIFVLSIDAPVDSAV